LATKQLPSQINNRKTMNLSKLTPAEGSVKNAKKRLGRGQGSGKGGTSTKGHKGAQSRSGYSAKRGFEGGQMPLQRRVPKFGFKNINRIEYRGINLDVIQGLIDNNKVNTIDLDYLVSKGLASKNDKVKVLGRGELKSKVEIKVHAFSASAKTAIEAQGGAAVSIEKA
jgi:large subunit ribosomal protein L15